MCSTLVDALKKAFNNGKITPTVFVFPPRQPGKRGPMFWNSQLLSFAAYEQEDGEVLGDPANLQLTKDIMQLGWKPPRLRSRWDLLPVVAMAEGDDPFIHELTPSDFPLVRILHPGHELQFEKLGLRWVPAPALSRLGFDIGGVQYTATPFIGWFMDAEIGVRNLADTFRYNALPQVAAALGWVETEHEIDRLPEYERLAVLSRAQTELNFAVFHSFKSSGVAMSDTLSASTMYCNYDDEHFRSKGYRLPSNPYWLAPPQGSIVPIWHRGGTPNYQPSPLVCRHVQDPVKAWRREQQSRISGTSIDRRSGFRHSSAITCPRASPQTCAPVDLNGESESETKPKIFICFCSAASTAKKLAEDLHKRLRRRVENKFSLHPVKPLNDLNFHKMSSSDTLLIIASTAGHGEVPLNGQRFLKTSIDGEAAAQISFSIFGNGSSMYGDRYNAAAKAIRDHLVKLDLRPIGDGLYAGDTAEEDPPWTQFEEWFRQLLEALHVEPQQLQGQSSQQRAGPKPKDWTEVVSTYSTAKLVDCRRTHASGIQHVRLDIGEQCYETLSHVSVLVPNDSAIVKRALRTIGLNGKELVWSIRGQDLTVKEFLTAFVDFERPFSNIDWARSWDFSPSQRRLIRELPVRESLQAFTWPWRGKVAITALVSAMPLKTPRIFSAASSQDLLGRQGKGQQLELLIQHRENGLVSDFLKKARSGARLRLCTTQLEDKTLLERVSGPVICFATGSGLALVLSLLKHRVLSRTGPRVSEESRCNPQSIDRESHSKQEAITLILGFRGCDSDIICQDLQEPIDEGVIDMLLMTPSNDQKLRAQDRVFESNVRDRIEEKLRCNATAVLVCALPEAAGEFARNLSAIVGCNIQESLGDRYIEQTYKPAC
jgi:nitric oxide synthase oxygenase domain/subunit/sulfite reductase alpha subunit-like flavoprotein